MEKTTRKIKFKNCIQCLQDFSFYEPIKKDNIIIFCKKTCKMKHNKSKE